jgi:hypothetical protein
MNEAYQLVNATLVMVFAAVMIVVGHLYIENRNAEVTAHSGGKDVFHADFTPLTARAHAASR